jgi:hypothetical protein
MFVCRVVEHSDVNLMTVTNVAVCFGPSLLRAREPTSLTAVIDIKFCNMVVEVLIQNCRQVSGNDSVRVHRLLSDLRQ